jgi:hypothetical protein
LVYADNVNVLGGTIRAIKKNTETLLASSKEIGLEVNAEKNDYMIMSGDQRAGQNHNVRVGNNSVERMEQFRYLGATQTYHNSIRGEIKSRLESGNACYHSVQDLRSSSLPFKNIKIKIYRNVILPVVLYGCET